MSRQLDILLLGGASGTGKTMLARALSAHFDVPVAQSDDFRLFAQGITSPAQLADLHFFVDPALSDLRNEMSGEEQAERLMVVANLVSRGFEVVIAHHLTTGLPMIVEGDAIAPQLAVLGEYSGRPADGRVHALFLDETDEEIILAGMRARGRGIESLTHEQAAREARRSRVFGNWLITEARRHKLPVLSSRPFETLEQRAFKTIDRMISARR